MKKFNISSIALALSLAFSASAMAQNMSKEDYKAAEKSIAAAHKADKARCDSLAHNAKDICKAASSRTMASASVTSLASSARDGFGLRWRRP